jgi:phosphatidylglycerol---prolipoprotein diacylglyceryl transferase
MIYWDPSPDLFIIPILNWPIKWYGLFFALGFLIGFSLFERILLRYFLQKNKSRKNSICELKRIALKVTDRTTLYVVIATALGARLGHFLFYENPSEYLKNPIEILQIWQGGLASHGAAIAIIIALYLLSRWTKKIDSGLTPLRLLDFITVPTALAGCFIRIGNLFNQEILGTATQLPWGFIFGHPMDGSLSIPRHPVQIYESIFYLIVFLILWRLSYRRSFLLCQGRLIGLFLVLVFGFRFFIEYLKLEQSLLISASGVLTMGQWLSIPLVILGTVLIFLSKSKSYIARH